MPRRTTRPKEPDRRTQPAGTKRRKGVSRTGKDEGLLLGRPVEDRGFETVEVSAAAATGIGVGTVLAGPVGAVIGGAVGAALGAAAGEAVEHTAGAAGETMDTGDTDDGDTPETRTRR